jgi:hypothetical protein
MMSEKYCFIIFAIGLRFSVSLKTVTIANLAKK